MLHPSYSDLMKKVNSEVEEGEAPVVNSRYSIVIATAKRARQIIDGADVLTKYDCSKPLSIAVNELNESKIRILNDEEYEALEEELTRRDELEAMAKLEAKFNGEEATDSATEKKEEEIDEVEEIIDIEESDEVLYEDSEENPEENDVE